MPMLENIDPAARHLRLGHQERNNREEKPIGRVDLTRFSCEHRSEASEPVSPVRGETDRIRGGGMLPTSARNTPVNKG